MRRGMTIDDRREREAKITIKVKSILKEVEEHASDRQKNNGHEILIDEYRRSPYKKFQDSQTPLNQILIKQAGSIEDMAHLSSVVSGAESFEVSRIYISEDDADGRAMVEKVLGELVGRTRLQKVAYLCYLAGLSNEFEFEYRHYGPFSEELADAMRLATDLKLVTEEERKTDWGGWYSVFTAVKQRDAVNPERIAFISAAAKVGAIELELAATAAFLFDEEGFGRDGGGDPWEETARRKPEKASDGRLEKAKAAYRKLKEIQTPKPLPEIA